MAKISKYVCDGCDAQVEQKTNVSPPGWYQATVTCANDIEAIEWEEMFDLCGPCSRKMDPRSWARLPKVVSARG